MEYNSDPNKGLTLRAEQRISADTTEEVEDVWQTRVHGVMPPLLSDPPFIGTNIMQSPLLSLWPPDQVKTDFVYNFGPICWFANLLTIFNEKYPFFDNLFIGGIYWHTILSIVYFGNAFISLTNIAYHIYRTLDSKLKIGFHTYLYGFRNIFVKHFEHSIDLFY